MSECDRCGKKIKYGTLCHDCDIYLTSYCQGLRDGKKQGRADTIDKLQEQIPKWHLCSDELPKESGRYMVATNNGRTTIYEFTTDAYRLDKYDFAEYKGQKKSLFYVYDSVWGYSECDHVIAWMELPKFSEVE